MGFSAVPLGHKFTAVLLAVAVGGGVYTWFRRNAVQTASTAEMSFDMHAARRIDPGFVQAPEPAVVFAQSILSDQRIANLSKQAYLSTSAMMSRIGEFRSRLVLTQPSGQTLRVRFRDPDAAKAVATANAVADALTSWAPSPNGPAPLSPEPTATSQPAAATAPAPAATQAAPPPQKKPAKAEENPASGKVAAALGAVQAQLSSTSRQLEEISSGHGEGNGYRGRAYAEADQQRLLKSQVRAAETKVEGLRTEAEGRDMRDRLGDVEDALRSVLSGGGVGVSAHELRREEKSLTRAIGVVEEQRQAIEKTEAAEPSAAPERAAATPPVPAPSPAQQTPQTAPGTGSGAITESNLGKSAPSASSETQSSQPPSGGAGNFGSEDAAMLNPLHLVRLAGPAMPPIWWPAAAAGFVCGLLYWLIAAAAQGPVEDEDTVTEGTSHYGRFITPDVPMAPVAAAPEPETFTGSLVERSSYRRAAFSYESAPGGSQPAEERNTSPEKSAQVDESPEAARGAAAAEIAPVREKVVEIDPWADLMEKALSETEIGKSFETERSEAGAREGDARRPSRPDRLAG